MESSGRRLVFVTRQGCTICADALRKLRLPALLARKRILVVDVDSDAELLDRFGSRVPVLLSSSGDVLAEGPLSRPAAAAAVRMSKRR